MLTHFSKVRPTFVYHIDLGDWWERHVMYVNIVLWDGQRSNEDYGHGLDKVFSRVELSDCAMV
jgi:hypothetical protein